MIQEELAKAVNGSRQADVEGAPKPAQPMQAGTMNLNLSQQDILLLLGFAFIGYLITKKDEE